LRIFDAVTVLVFGYGRRMDKYVRKGELKSIIGDGEEIMANVY